MNGKVRPPRLRCDFLRPIAPAAAIFLTTAKAVRIAAQIAGKTAEISQPRPPRLRPSGKEKRAEEMPRAQVSENVRKEKCRDTAIYCILFWVYDTIYRIL